MLHAVDERTANAKQHRFFLDFLHRCMALTVRVLNIA